MSAGHEGRSHAGMALERRAAERVQVTCWCEAEVLWVPTEFVRQGRTGTCARPTCKPPRRPLLKVWP